MNALTQFPTTFAPAATGFSAIVDSVFHPNGTPIESDFGRGVYRDDTGELLAICGPSYHPVQHSDVLNPVFQTLDRLGYQIEERDPSRYDLYDLKGRKGAFGSVKLADNGAVMRADFILGDFIEPTGSGSFLTKGEDTNFFRISVLNSHNSKYAVRVNTSYLRLICMNGMTSPNFSVSTYGKHTQNFNLDAMAKKIEKAMTMMDQDADRFGLWARTKLTPKQAEAFLIATIAKLPNKPNGDDNHSQPLVDKILRLFRDEDQTVWGLYNAVTAWQTHGEIKAGSNLLTARIGRETKVAAMLRAPEFKGLVTA